MQCPICENGTIEEKDKLWVCSEQKYNSETSENEGCEFKIWKKFLQADIDETIVEKLINGEEVKIDNLVSKKGNTFTGIISFNKDTIQLDMRFPTDDELADEDGIVEFSKGYKKDGIIVWKTSFNSVVTKEEAIKLFNGEEVSKDDFVSKKGKTFAGILFLNSDNKVEMKINN